MKSPSQTRKKLFEAIKILENRLPKSMFVQIKPYSTVYSMLRHVTRNCFRGNQNRCLSYYSNYFDDPTQANYRKSKYFPSDTKGRKNKVKAYDICAIAEDPIIVALDNIEGRTLKELVFLLLHEMGHHYFRKKRGNNNDTEKECDDFAARWMRRLKKEGLV